MINVVAHCDEANRSRIYTNSLISQQIWNVIEHRWSLQKIQVRPYQPHGTLDRWKYQNYRNTPIIDRSKKAEKWYAIPWVHGPDLKQWTPRHRSWTRKARGYRAWWTCCSFRGTRISLPRIPSTPPSVPWWTMSLSMNPPCLLLLFLLPPLRIRAQLSASFLPSNSMIKGYVFRQQPYRIHPFSPQCLIVSNYTTKFVEYRQSRPLVKAW